MGARSVEMARSGYEVTGTYAWKTRSPTMALMRLFCGVMMLRRPVSKGEPWVGSAGYSLRSCKGLELRQLDDLVRLRRRSPNDLQRSSISIRGREGRTP